MQILLIPLVLVLPGWALLPFVVKSGPLQLPRKVFLALYLSLLLLSLISLLTLAAGVFRPWLVLACQLAVAVGAGIIGRRNRPDAEPVRRSVLIALAFSLCVGLALSFWGSVEIALGGRDPGTYLATGELLREGAGVSFQDSLWSDLSPMERDVFTHWDHGIPQRFPGFYLQGAERERVKLEVLPLYPCWEALAIELGGVAGAMRFNAYLSLLSLLALALAGLELGGPAAGLLAPLFLGTSFPQIYFSRLPCADVAAQTLVLGALASYLIVRPASRGILVSGLGLGATFFTHATAWALAPGIVAYATLYDRNVRKGWLATVTPFAAASALDLVFQRWEYVPSRLAKLHIGQESLPLLALLTAVGIGSWIVASRAGRGTAARVKVAAATLVVAFTAWGYVLRPELIKTIHSAGKALPHWDRFTMRWIAAYMSPLVFGVGIAEAVRRVARGTGTGALYPVALLPHLLLFGYRQLVHPDHPWAARRFLVAVLPLLALMAAVLLGRLWSARHARSSVAAAVGAGAALWWLMQTSIPVLGLREGKGMVRVLKDLAARFEAIDVVVVEGSQAGYLVAVPLQYLYHTQVLLYAPERISDALVLADAATRWIREGREVFYLSPWSAGPTPISNVTLQWLDHVSLTTARPRTNWTGPPQGREWLSLPLCVHRFTAAESLPPSTYAWVGIGEDDFGRVEGFYGPESGPGSGEVYRWTGRRAKVLFPPLATAGPLKLTMRLSAPRARGDAPVVRVYVSEHLVGELRPSLDWAEYETLVPQVDPTKATVVLESDVWNPLHSGFSPDDRFLGVRVDWVRLEVAG